MVHDTAVFSVLLWSRCSCLCPCYPPLFNVFSSLCFVFQIEGWHCPLFSSSLPCCPCSASLRTIHLPVMTVLSHTQVFVSDTMSPVVSTKQLWLQQNNGCCVSLLSGLVSVCLNVWWCACILICVRFIWKQNISWCLSSNSVDVFFVQFQKCITSIVCNIEYIVL